MLRKKKEIFYKTKCFYCGKEVVYKIGFKCIFPFCKGATTVNINE